MKIIRNFVKKVVTRLKRLTQVDLQNLVVGLQKFVSDARRGIVEELDVT